jgi:hypothetical protein
MCVRVGAQQSDHPAGFGSLHRSAAYIPSLRLSDGTAFPFGSAFAWMEMTPADFLPNWRPEGWENMSDLSLAQTAPEGRRRTIGASSPGYSKDSSKEFVDVRETNLLENVHGEVGFLYGRSAGGRYSREVESGYIFGTTGDDKVQISVGAFYENSTVTFPRRGR